MDKRPDMMRHFPKRLNRWRGARARLWTLSVGHPTLTILLTRDGSPGCLMIACGGPERIESPHDWENSNIQIELGVRGFCVVDQAARVLISDCSVQLTEMPAKPWELPKK